MNVTSNRTPVNGLDGTPDVRMEMAQYYSSVRRADDGVGAILKALEESGQSKNTIVVFTSDHGYHMGEHGYWQKTTLFENAARVPLIIAAPGAKAAGQATQCPAEMIDFYPTLADLCGLEAPANLSGVSLKPALHDPSARPRTDALTQYDVGYSLRAGQYRYTEWGKNGALGAELYDHESDPGELTNLARRPESATIVRQLSMRLRERIADAQKKPDGLVQKQPIRKRRSK